MPFVFKPLKIPEVILVETKFFPDDRGFFKELFKESVFAQNGIKDHFVQDNFSHSSKGVLRGLHYQIKPKAQSKLVSVVQGEIFDVAIDIRKNSPTYGKWVAEILNDENHKMLYVPQGFAHGFCVLSNEANILYKVNEEYSPENDRGIIWNDPDIEIKWPIENPIVSEKDNRHPFLKDAENNFEYLH